MSGIEHPISKDVDVQFLSPRCPCSGKRFAVVRGKISKANKLSDGRYSYTIIGEKKAVPQEGIIKILGNKK